MTFRPCLLALATILAGLLTPGVVRADPHPDLCASPEAAYHAEPGSVGVSVCHPEGYVEADASGSRVYVLNDGANQSPTRVRGYGVLWVDGADSWYCSGPGSWNPGDGKQGSTCVP